MSKPLLQMMTRKGCHLCNDAYIASDLAERNGLCDFEAIDIDQHENLKVKYGIDVPVLLINGREHVRHFVDYSTLCEALLLAAKDDKK